jgi:hypothetical protein
MTEINTVSKSELFSVLRNMELTAQYKVNGVLCFRTNIQVYWIGEIESDDSPIKVTFDEALRELYWGAND